MKYSGSKQVFFYERTFFLSHSESRALYLALLTGLVFDVRSRKIMFEIQFVHFAVGCELRSREKENSTSRRRRKKN